MDATNGKESRKATVDELQSQANNGQPNEHGDGSVDQRLSVLGNE